MYTPISYLILKDPEYHFLNTVFEALKASNLC